MKYEYGSVLAPIIKSFLDMKHGLGFKYESECKLLRRVDQSALIHELDDVVLTKEFVNDFIKKHANEKDINITSRVTIIRELAKYMNSQGYKAYIVPYHEEAIIQHLFLIYLQTKN